MLPVIMVRNGNYTVVTIGNQTLNINDDEQPMVAVNRVLAALSQEDQPKKVKKDVCEECNGSGLVEDYAEGAGRGGTAHVTCPSCGGKKNA